ncbi:MAG: hypothetical protein WBQ76_13880 [Candidatus Korobacteraceae bacterium]
MTDLRVIRKTARMTQTQLSKKARVSRFRIALAETEGIELRPDEIAAITKALQPGLERAQRVVAEFQGPAKRHCR